MSLRVGIGGPVGSGKTALTLSLCRALRERYEIAVVTNDIYTEEDAQFLVRNEALAPERLKGADVGALVQHGRMSARVTGFWNVLDDTVTNITLSITPQLITKQRANADKMRAAGR